MTPAVTVISEKRFGDDVDDDDLDHDIADYPGVTYQVAIADRTFEIRAYDNEPGAAVVIRPSDARTAPGVRELVDFVVGILKREIVEFYSGPDGTYRAIDTQTLEFKKR